MRFLRYNIIYSATINNTDIVNRTYQDRELGY